MNFDEMRDNELQSMKKAATVGLTVAGVGTTALAGRGVYVAGKTLANTDPEVLQSQIQSYMNTPQAKNLMKYVDTGIRAYSDVNAYVASTYIDQTLNRFEQKGTIDRVGDTVAKAADKATKPAMANIAANINTNISAIDISPAVDAVSKRLDEYSSNGNYGKLSLAKHNAARMAEEYKRRQGR